MTDIIVKDIKNGSEYYYGGSAEVSAEDVSYDNSSSGAVADNLQDAMDEVFQSVSNGKELIADAITDKGVSTSATDSFQTMADNIGLIPVKPTVVGNDGTVICNYNDSRGGMYGSIVSDDGYRIGVVYNYYGGSSYQHMGVYFCKTPNGEIFTRAWEGTQYNSGNPIYKDNDGNFYIYSGGNDGAYQKFDTNTNEFSNYNGSVSSFTGFDETKIDVSGLNDSYTFHSKVYGGLFIYNTMNSRWFAAFIA